MAKAIWNNTIVAESDMTIMVEGNHYFPPSAIKREYLQPGAALTFCPWKGAATYYDLVVDGQINREAAWCYASPKPAAKQIKGYVAFWRGVQIVAA